MELQFHKSQFPCLQQVKWEVQTQEQTQEVRLSESMPDIGSVLGAWGQVLLRGKEWRSGSMQVTGGVMAWVAYRPEEGGAVQCVDAWIPFQLHWEMPDTELDGKICVLPLLRSVDARSTSARKIMLRATVSALAQALVPGQAQLYSPDELPEDIQVLKKCYPVRLPKEAGEKAFSIEEELELPGSCAPMAKPMYYCMRPKVNERKVMGDKLVYRGQALLHLLYCTHDGSLCAWDFELPFSQYAQLDGSYDQDAEARVTPVLTSLELDADPEGRLRLKAAFTVQYVISDCTVLELVEDAYSNCRPVAVKCEHTHLPTLLEEQTQCIQAQQTAHIDGRVVDVAFYPDHPRLHRSGEGVEVSLPGQFQVLWYDDGGVLQSSTARWEGAWSVPVGEDAALMASVQPAGLPQCSMTGDGAALRSEVSLELTTLAGEGVEAVTALEVGTCTQPDPERPSLILRRMEDGSLWMLAKECGSTVDAIRQANALTGDPAPQQLLLIPVS